MNGKVPFCFQHLSCLAERPKKHIENVTREARYQVSRHFGYDGWCASKCARSRTVDHAGMSVCRIRETTLYFAMQRDEKKSTGFPEGVSWIRYKDNHGAWDVLYH